MYSSQKPCVLLEAQWLFHVHRQKVLHFLIFLLLIQKRQKNYLLFLLNLVPLIVLLFHLLKTNGSIRMNAIKSEGKIISFKSTKIRTDVWASYISTMFFDNNGKIVERIKMTSFLVDLW